MSPRHGARASTSAASRWRSSGSAAPTSTTRSSRSPAAATGHVRGFLHFVPSYGREAVSLSFMRRDPETPNGLTEFLVARSIEAFRARGTEEVSLNFAAFARLLDRARERCSSAWRPACFAGPMRGSRSRASTASTRSSTRAGSRATSSTRAGWAWPAPGSRRPGRKARSRSRWPADEAPARARRRGTVVAACGSASSCSAAWRCSCPRGRSISPSHSRPSMWRRTGTSSGSGSISALAALAAAAVLAFRRRSRWTPVLGGALAAALVCDAWFDVMTSDGRRPLGRRRRWRCSPSSRLPRSPSSSGSLGAWTPYATRLKPPSTINV